jgi:hypothetical protein
MTRLTTHVSLLTTALCATHCLLSPLPRRCIDLVLSSDMKVEEEEAKSAVQWSSTLHGARLYLAGVG